jgi:hypothetical protein
MIAPMIDKMKPARHISVGAKGESDRPKSKQLIDVMTANFQSQASEGRIRAAGICFDVRIVPPGQVDKTDAFQLALERENEAVDVFLPYTQLPDGEFTYGEMFASHRTPHIFPAATRGGLTNR